VRMCARSVLQARVLYSSRAFRYAASGCRGCRGLHRSMLQRYGPLSIRRYDIGGGAGEGSDTSLQVLLKQVPWALAVFVSSCVSSSSLAEMIFFSGRYFGWLEL